MAIVERREDVVKKIPDYQLSALTLLAAETLHTVADYDPTQLFLWHGAMHDQREA